MHWSFAQHLQRKNSRKYHTLISTPQKGGTLLMDVIDCDRALYYTHRSQWDNLLILMVRTDDDFLSKKIEHFCMPTILNETTASFKKSFILYYATLIMQRNIRSTNPGASGRIIVLVFLIHILGQRRDELLYFLCCTKNMHTLCSKNH